MKQLFTTKYVSFMAIGLMAAMSLGSCSNDDEPNVPPTGTTLAKITMGVTGLPQTKATAGDVNIGGEWNDIENIVLVPITNDVWSEPINLGAFETTTEFTTQTYTANIPNGTNKFRVYGGAADKVKTPIDANTTFSLVANETPENGKTVYDPAGLYFFKETGVADAGTNTTDVVIKVEDGTEQAAVSAETKTIDITGVRYGVGLLATKARVSDQIKYKADGTAADPVDFNGTLTLNAVFVGGQPVAVDNEFKPLPLEDGETVRYVRDATMNDEQSFNGTLPEMPVEFTSMPVHCYTTLFETLPNEQAVVVLRVQSSVAIFAKDNEGNYSEVPANTNFYLPAILTPAANESVFSQFTRTNANLTINSLANAMTELPDEPTDVDLSITVDLSWENGFTFEETID